MYSFVFHRPCGRSCLERNNRCPLCGAHLTQFLILHRPFFRWRPVCRSLQRHRVGWLYFQQYILPTHPVRRVLHIAPEEWVKQAFHRLPGIAYVSMDLSASRVTVCANVEQLLFDSDRFDLVYCSHVLEHVPEDHAAMRELHRVLKPGQVAIILVPMWNEPTFENPNITDPIE